MSRFKKLYNSAGLFTVGIMVILSGCAHIPENPDKPVSYSQAATEVGLLAEASQAVLKGAAEDQTAFMLIPRNDDALKWRLALIDSAQQSIDLQVFIWSNDESGRLILDRIIAATQRGVTVRLLVDDMPKDWSDQGTALVARRLNLQLRRFNPGRVRKGLIGRAFQMSTQFQQLNRRMHNKQLIVDGQWAIVGGRNIGNPYFGLSKKYNNRDMDLLLTGEVISEMADDFDEYWNADVAYPGDAMFKELSQEQADKIWKGFHEAVVADRELLEQTTIPVERIDWTDAFDTLPERMVKGTAECLQDSPEVKGDRGVRLVDQLSQVDFEATYQTSVITPYMIPSDDFLDDVEKTTKEEGRKVRFLVPSMESNNHTMAHSHYKKYRKKLLSAGAELYEFQGWPSDALRAYSDTPPIKAEFISLHTKAFAVDERWVLLGSLNIDPRSIEINTEHMLVIDSPDLAKLLLADFETMISPENAWAVTQNEKGKLRWTSSKGERKNQPARSYGQRWKDFFWRLMPVESQL
jgi:putative cardiolipin synthase